MMDQNRQPEKELHFAIFQVVADNEDITAIIQDRVLELSIVDKPGLESDELTLKLDDRDGRVAMPSKGAKLRISLGWMTAAGPRLDYMGAYSVDEISWSAGPDTLTIKGKPADMRAAAKSQRQAAWEGVSLAKIVEDVAARHGWQPICRVDAEVDRADQLGESDLHFVTRLSRKYDATATVKDGKLIVMPRGGGKTASGRALPGVSITRQDVQPGSFTITFPDRASHGETQTSVHDKKTGKKTPVKVIDASKPEATKGAVHVDRHTYSSEKAAKSAAQSRMNNLNRATCSGSFSMVGNANLAAEKHITLSGFKSGVDGTYLAEEVSHTYSGKSWETKVSFNAGNAGKAGGDGKKGKKLKVVDASKP